MIIRSSGDAACVAPTTAEKLENAEWGTIVEERMIESSIEEGIATEESIEEVNEEEGKEFSVELSESMGIKGN